MAMANLYDFIYFTVYGPQEICVINVSWKPLVIKAYVFVKSPALEDTINR